MARKGPQPLKGPIARLRARRAARREKSLERKHQAERAGSSDPWNHMYTGGGR